MFRKSQILCFLYNAYRDKRGDKLNKIKIKTRTNRAGKRRYTAGYFTADGREHSAGTFGSRLQAEHAARIAWEAGQRNDWIDPKAASTVVDRYVTERWLSGLSGIETKTAVGYESTYRNHIHSRFGRVAIGSIKRSDVKIWLAGLEAAGLGRSSQRQAYLVLGMIFKAARDDGIVSGSIPTEGLRTLPIPRPPVTIFTRDQWKAFLQNLDPYWRPLCAVGVATGMRSSELRALSPAAIRWNSQQIIVAATLTPLSRRTNGGERYLSKGYTKNKRGRVLEVDEEVLHILANSIAERGLEADSTSPIFVGITGAPFDQKVLQDAFREACRKAGIPRRTPKHMRSTCASWMLKDTGGDLMRVRLHLGHADVATTQRYLSVVDETHSDQSEALEEFRQRYMHRPPAFASRFASASA